MAEPLFDLAALTAPIPGDDPAGVPMDFLLRQNLDNARKDFEPHPDDPSQPPIPKNPDWAGIIKETITALTQTSKDLRLATRLVEAATKQHGFRGFFESLTLLATLVEECWDRLHPKPEEGEDEEVRAGPFTWIAEADTGARFPFTLQTVPLITFENTPYSYHDWKETQTRKAATKDFFGNEVPSEPTVQIDLDRSKPIDPEIGQDLENCLRELTRLEQALNAKLTEHSPNLSGLRKPLEECQQFIQRITRNQETSETPEDSGTADQPGPDGAPVPGKLGQITTREEAYRQLAHIANTLERIEPHSPIPDLLRRAIELGRLPFRKLIGELVREANLLSEIHREFGIKEAAPPEETS